MSVAGDGQRHVVLQEEIVGMTVECGDVIPVTSAEVVNADDKVPLRQKLVGQVEPEEASAACQQRDLACGGS